MADGLFEGAQIGHVDEIHRELPAREDFAEKALDAIVGFERRDDMIVRRESLEDRRRGRQAGREGRGRSTAFDEREGFFERGAIRIISAGIIETGRETARPLPCHRLRR